MGIFRMLPLLVMLGAPTLAIAQPPAPPGPPVGEERARILEGIHKTYPTIPDIAAQTMADARRQIVRSGRCEYLDFVQEPESGASAPVAAQAKLFSDSCALDISDLTPAKAEQKLAGKAFTFEVAQDQLTVFARSKEPFVEICCSFQVPLIRLGDSDLWAGRWRAKDSDRAIINLFVAGLNQLPTYYGPNAPAAPSLALPLKGRIVEHDLASAALGETRKTQFYLPPGWTKEKTWPVVFMTDGAARGYAPMVEALILQGRIRPVIIASAENGEIGIVGPRAADAGPDVRSTEYLRDRAGDSGRFERHMTFFTHELADYATTEFSASRRREDHLVAGYSSGGAFALWAGLMHPELYVAAVPMSPGVAGVSAADLKDGQRAKFRLAVGLYETSFVPVTRNAEAVLRQGGYDVQAQYLVAGHDQSQWQLILRDALIEVFGTPPTRSPTA